MAKFSRDIVLDERVDGVRALLAYVFLVSDAYSDSRVEGRSSHQQIPTTKQEHV